MSKDSNNPVYKLMTDKLQLVLINVLIGSILNTTDSQGMCSDAFKGRWDSQ